MQTNDDDPKSLPDHMVKGNLVEQIVAMFHEAEGVTVQTKALLPSRRNPTDHREIDVLVSGDLVGYPVHIGIECKNYANRIGTGKIDEFRGKLEDVGIPTEQGIYVSVNGYSKGAINRARDLGIRLLVLDGLTPDRLNTEVHQAFQSVVYLLLSVDSITVQATNGEVDPWELMWTKNAEGKYGRGAFDMVWGMWRQGLIPYDIGEHTFPLDLPPGWTWHLGEEKLLDGIDVTVRVLGLVLQVEGTANQHRLEDVLDPQRSKTRIAGTFPNPGSIPVIAVNSEEELQERISSDALVSIDLGRFPLPRILLLGKAYWPMSQRSAQVFSRIAFDMAMKGRIEDLQNVSFLDIEGSNLERVWDPIWDQHPGASDPEWPFVVRKPTWQPGRRRKAPRVRRR